MRKISVSSMDGTNGSSTLVFADQLGIIARVLREDAARKRQTFEQLVASDNDGYGFDKRATECDKLAAFFEASLGHSTQPTQPQAEPPTPDWAKVLVADQP